MSNLDKLLITIVIRIMQKWFGNIIVEHNIIGEITAVVFCKDKSDYMKGNNEESMG